MFHRNCAELLFFNYDKVEDHLLTEEADKSVDHFLKCRANFELVKLKVQIDANSLLDSHVLFNNAVDKYFHSMQRLNDDASIFKSANLEQTTIIVQRGHENAHKAVECYSPPSQWLREVRLSISDLNVICTTPAETINVGEG